MKVFWMVVIAMCYMAFALIRYGKDWFDLPSLGFGAIFLILAVLAFQKYDDCIIKEHLKDKRK